MRWGVVLHCPDPPPDVLLVAPLSDLLVFPMDSFDFVVVPEGRAVSPAGKAWEGRTTDMF